MSKIRTHIAEIPQKIGEIITVKGHAQTVRAQSSVAFVVLRESTFLFRGPTRLMP